MGVLLDLVPLDGEARAVGAEDGIGAMLQIPLGQITCGGYRRRLIFTGQVAAVDQREPALPAGGGGGVAGIGPEAGRGTYGIAGSGRGNSPDNIAFISAADAGRSSIFSDSAA